MRRTMYLSSKSAIKRFSGIEKNDFMSAELIEEEVPEEDPEEVQSCEEDPEEEDNVDPDEEEEPSDVEEEEEEPSDVEEVEENPEEEEIEEEEVVAGERGETGIEDVEEDEEEESSDVEEEEEEPEEEPCDVEEEEEEPSDVEEEEEDQVADPDDVEDVEKEEEENPDEEEGMEVEVGERGNEKGIEEEEEDPEEDPDEEGMDKEEEDPEEDPDEEMEAYVDVCNYSFFVEANDSAVQENGLTAEANTRKEIPKLNTQPEEITTEMASGKFNKRKQNSCSVEAPINDSVFLIKRAKCNVDSAEQENDCAAEANANEVIPDLNSQMEEIYTEFAAGKSEKATITDSALVTEVTKSGNEIDEKILFVGALPMDFDDDKLKELFLPFGPLCGAIVLKGIEGKAKGCGFVHFDNLSNAERAMSSMNGRKLNGGSVLNVMIADIPPSDFVLNKITPETILYVRFLPPAFNNEKLRELFLAFGRLRFAYVVRKRGPKTRRACVAFANPSNAARALLSMNSFELDGKRLLVTMESCPLLPTPLIPRGGFMKPRCRTIKRKRIDVGGLPLNFDDNKLMELFASFRPLSAKVYTDTEIGKSRCGHVRFESRSVAAEAVSLMNGFKLDGREIIVKIESGPPSHSLASEDPHGVIDATVVPTISGSEDPHKVFDVVQKDQSVRITNIPQLASEDPHGVMNASILKDSTCKSKSSSTARTVPLMNDCKLDGGELSVQIAAGVPPLDSSSSEDPHKVIDVVVPNDRSMVDRKECSGRITNIPQSGSSGSKVIDDTILKSQNKHKKKRKCSIITPAVLSMKYSKVDGRESSVRRRTTGIPRSGSSGSELLRMPARNQFASASLALPPTYLYPSYAYSRHHTGEFIEYPPAYPRYYWDNHPPVPNFWGQPQVPPQFSNHYLYQESEGYLNPAPPVPGLLKGFGLHR